MILNLSCPLSLISHLITLSHPISPHPTQVKKRENLHLYLKPYPLNLPFYSPPLYLFKRSSHNVYVTRQSQQGSTYVWNVTTN
jgi:hypothetical protein